MEKADDKRCENPEGRQEGQEDVEDVEQLGPVPEESPEQCITMVDTTLVDEPIIEIMQHMPSHN